MRNTVTEMRLIAKRILLSIPVVALILFTTGVAAQEEENVSVRVNAPEFVSGTFDVTIDIYNVIDLYGGNFDFSFDPDVVNANGVYEGEIDGAMVSIDMWRLVEDDRVRVLFNIDDETNPEGVSGSGYLASIRFEVVGDDGDTSALELSDGVLSWYESDDHPLLAGNAIIPPEINADWSGDVVTVGDTGTVETEKTASTPVQTVAPRSSSSSSLDSGAGSVTASTPEAEHVSDVAVPVGTSGRDEPDGWDVLAEHNFIEIYSFIGLLAFIYTLTLLK